MNCATRKFPFGYPVRFLLLIAELNVADMLARWKEAIIFYSLRLLLGPVIESLVLLDRYLYLTENGKQCDNHIFTLIRLLINLKSIYPGMEKSNLRVYKLIT